MSCRLLKSKNHFDLSVNGPCVDCSCVTFHNVIFCDSDVAFGNHGNVLPVLMVVFLFLDLFQFSPALITLSGRDF